MQKECEAMVRDALEYMCEMSEIKINVCRYRVYCNIMRWDEMGWDMIKR